MVDEKMSPTIGKQLLKVRICSFLRILGIYIWDYFKCMQESISSTTCILGIEIRSSDLRQTPFPSEPSNWHSLWVLDSLEFLFCFRQGLMHRPPSDLLCLKLASNSSWFLVCLLNARLQQDLFVIFCNIYWSYPLGDQKCNLALCLEGERVKHILHTVSKPLYPYWFYSPFTFKEINHVITLLCAPKEKRIYIFLYLLV